MKLLFHYIGTSIIKELEVTEIRSLKDCYECLQKNGFLRLHKDECKLIEEKEVYKIITDYELNEGK